MNFNRLTYWNGAINYGSSGIWSDFFINMKPEKYNTITSNSGRQQINSLLYYKKQEVRFLILPVNNSFNEPRD